MLLETENYSSEEVLQLLLGVATFSGLLLTAVREGEVEISEDSEILNELEKMLTPIFETLEQI